MTLMFTEKSYEATSNDRNVTAGTTPLRRDYVAAVQYAFMGTTIRSVQV